GPRAIARGSERRLYADGLLASRTHRDHRDRHFDGLCDQIEIGARGAGQLIERSRLAQAFTPRRVAPPLDRLEHRDCIIEAVASRIEIISVASADLYLRKLREHVELGDVE